MADLNVTIGTDATAFNRGMQQAAQTAQTTANSINASAATIGAGVARGSNQAAFALTNLGRVAQDAPFGFIGIQNNLNPLLESFQRLRAESGSNGAALKALGSSLIGPAGIGVALSVVTAGIVLWTQYQQKANKELQNSKKTADDYINSLDAVRSAELKGAQDGQQEITRLQILYAATQNSTLSIKERGAAYDELSSKYPKFFTNAEKEQTLLGDNYTAYLKLSTAILAAAQAKAFENKIGELSNKQFENESKLTDLVTARSKIRADITKSEAQLKANSEIKVNGSGTVVGGGYNDTATAEKINGLKAKGLEVEGAINQKLQEQSDIVGTITQLQQRATAAEVTANFKTVSELDDKNGKLKEQKTYLQQLEDELKKLQDAEQKSGSNRDFWNTTDRQRNIAALTEKIELLKDAVKSIPEPKIKGTKAVGSEQQNFAADALSFAGIDNKTSKQSGTDPATIKGMQDYVKHTREIANQIGANEYNNKVLAKQEKIGRQLISTFGGGLTDAFQSALNGTQSFVSAMGQFLLQLITKLVAAALAAVALAVILSAVGFGPGIGGAASQIGSFKNIFGSLSGIALADGGITQGPTRALIGEGREQEAVIPLSKLGQFVNSNGGGMADGKIVGVMRGSDLLLQYRRAEKSNQRRG